MAFTGKRCPTELKPHILFFLFATKRKKRGFVVNMSTSIDSLKNRVFFLNNGATTFMIIRICFMQLHVGNKFVLRMIKD